MPPSTSSISDYFESEYKLETSHNWFHCKTTDVTSEGDLAKRLAYRIVEQRLVDCPQYFESWRARVETGAALATPDAEALKAFLANTFPENLTPHLEEHLQGAVAEYMWYFLQLEGVHFESAIHVEPPKGDVTDKGGDGISFHEDPGGVLTFRLWELKKFDGNGKVTSTATRACKQLDERGAQYIAQFTAIAQKFPVAHPIAGFCGELPHHWINSTPQASAGVSVGTSHDRVSEKPFAQMGARYLVRLSHANGRQGLICSTSSLAQLAKSVWEWVWKGL